MTSGNALVIKEDVANEHRDIKGLVEASGITPGVAGHQGGEREFRRAIQSLSKAGLSVQMQDMGGGGKCGWNVVSCAFFDGDPRHDHHMVQGLRAAVARALDVVETVAEDPFAVRRFHDHEQNVPTRGRRGSASRNSAYIKLRDQELCEELGRGDHGHNWFLDNDLRLWSREGIPEDPHVVRRIWNHGAYDGLPESDLLVAAKVRAVFVSSPDWLYENQSLTTSWIESLDFLMIAYLAKLRISVLSADENGRLFERFWGKETSTPLYVGLLNGNHYVRLCLAEGQQSVPVAPHERSPLFRPLVCTGSFCPNVERMVHVQALVDDDADGRKTIATYFRARVKLDVPDMTIRTATPTLFRAVCQGVAEDEETKCTAVLEWKRHGKVWELERNDMHCCVRRRKATTSLQYTELAGLLMEDVLPSTRPGDISTTWVRDRLALRSLLVESEKAESTRAHLLELWLGTAEWNYSVLRSYLRVEKRNHEGFYWFVDSSVDDVFQRLMVVPAYAKSFTSRCLRIIASDGTHSSGASTGGTWLFTHVPVMGTRLDYADKRRSAIVPIAASFHAEGETSAAWTFHFEHMRRADLFDGRDTVLCFCDGRNGLDTIVRDVRLAGGTQLHQVRDLIHVARNITSLKDATGTRLVSLPFHAIQKLMVSIARAGTRELFISAMDHLRSPFSNSRHDLAARQALSRVISERYLSEGAAGGFAVQKSAWVQERMPLPRHEMFTSNMAESFNEVFNMIDGRHAPIRFAVERLLAWCEKRFSALAAHARNLSIECDMMYGYFGEIAEGEKASSGGFRVERSEHCFRLTGPSGVFVVNCSARTCSCGLPMSHGIPCRHVFAVQRHFASSDDDILRHFVAPGLLFVDLQESLAFQFGMKSNSQDLWVPDGLRKEMHGNASGRFGSSVHRGSVGAGGSKRKKSIGEESMRKRPKETGEPRASRKKATRCCGACGAVGHIKSNRVLCPKHPLYRG